MKILSSCSDIEAQKHGQPQTYPSNKFSAAFLTRVWSSLGEITLACPPQLNIQRVISSRSLSSKVISIPSLPFLPSGLIFCDACQRRSLTNRAANASNWMRIL